MCRQTLNGCLALVLEVTQEGQILPANADFDSCDDLEGDTGRFYVVRDG